MDINILFKQIINTESPIVKKEIFIAANIDNMLRITATEYTDKFSSFGL